MKSELRLAQEKHTYRIGLLLLFAHNAGIGLTQGDAFRDPRVHGEIGVKMAYGHKNSCHKLKLANDLNAIDDQEHVTLHDEWDRLGGAKRLLNDMNHYSSGWKGMI